MRLKHYARVPEVNLDRSIDYSTHYPRFDKPNGLWVSVEGPDDWKNWCQQEDYCTEWLDNEHEVVLTETANILYLETLEAVLTLQGKFKAPDKYGGGPDWEVIRGLYDGIIIAPYQWEARLAAETTWYSSWDCASGCIWNLDAVESITLVRDEVKA